MHKTFSLRKKPNIEETYFRGKEVSKKKCGNTKQEKNKIASMRYVPGASRMCGRTEYAVTYLPNKFLNSREAVRSFGREPV